MMKRLFALLAVTCFSSGAADDKGLARKVVDNFVRAIANDPKEAMQFVEGGAGVGFGAFTGSMKMKDFISSATLCRVKSVSEPSVPPSWKLYDAHYVKVVWACPFSDRQESDFQGIRRRGPILVVEFFVRQKIMEGRGHYSDR